MKSEKLISVTKKKHDYHSPSEWEKGSIPWNKGKTGYTTLRKGQKQSDETKKNMKKNHWSKTDPEGFMKHVTSILPKTISPEEKAFYKWISKFIHVRQQEPVGKYSCDFYIPEYNLIIEIDGHHIEKERDEYIKSQGYDVVHFLNE